MEINELNYIQEQIQEKTNESQKAKGAIEQIHKKLKESYDCDTVEEAQELLKTQQKQKEKLENKYDSICEEITEKWNEYSDESH